MSQDLRTRAIVLKRVNYGETDRILSLLTPEGKHDVIAKGVRKEKSKLAGGIEMFCLSEVTIHHKTTSSDGLGILTSAKMLEFYQTFLTDLSTLSLTSRLLKHSAKLAEHVQSPDLFNLLHHSFHHLDRGQSPSLVETHFLLNLAKISGNDPNFYYDYHGAKLAPDQTYRWDSLEQALAPDPAGPIRADHIKLMRLMLVSPLATVVQVKDIEPLLPPTLHVAKSVTQQ